jgi:hypothetical protein
LTVLFGDTTFTGYTSAPPPAGSDGGYLSATPFVSTTGGQATSLYCYLKSAIGQTFVMALYDATGQRLAYSVPVTVTADGLQQFPIKTTTIQPLLAYQILLMPQASNFGYNFGVDSNLFSTCSAVATANAQFPNPPFQLSGVLPSGFQAPTFFCDGQAGAQLVLPTGKVGQATLDTMTVITQAIRRCRLRPAVVTDEMIDSARTELQLLLTSDLALRGVQLFAVDTVLMAMKAGKANMTMPPGTIDVLNANYRYMNCFQRGISTVYTPTSGTQITTLGITWSGPSTPILIQYSDDGIDWTTLRSESPDASAGDTTLFDLDGSVPSLYWQVVPNPMPNPPFLVEEVAFYGTLSQTPMSPYSRDDFANLSNTFFQGRPFQYWLDRQEPWPIMKLWPTPMTNDEQNACIIFWRKKQIADVGELSDRLNVPNRWLTAIIDMLAFRFAKTEPEVDANLIPMLKAESQESFNLARSDERENAVTRIQPQIYVYTR